jgi:hypothetical protein
MPKMQSSKLFGGGSSICSLCRSSVAREPELHRTLVVWSGVDERL